MYKAQIEFIAYEDNYIDGETADVASSWDETLTADTQSELRNKILEATYSKWEDLDDEQVNEYDWCTEYQTTYLANYANYGVISDVEIDKWKNGKIKLYSVHCHILVTEITEKKAVLN